jgi:hypothetical protein
MDIRGRFNRSSVRRASFSLRRLKPAIVAELRPAVEANARAVHEAQKRLVEVVSGDLQASLTYYEVAGWQGLKWRVAAGDEAAFYARMIEFGTPRNAASPFFYPAYRALRRALKARMSRAIRRAVRKVARQ